MEHHEALGQRTPVESSQSRSRSTRKRGDLPHIVEVGVFFAVLAGFLNQLWRHDERREPKEYWRKRLKNDDRIIRDTESSGG